LAVYRGDFDTQLREKAKQVTMKVEVSGMGRARETSKFWSVLG